MANTIENNVAYSTTLDERYAKDSVTSVLDYSHPELIAAITGSGEVKIPKVTTSGAGNYDRAEGYTVNSGTFTFESVKPDYDRGTSFTVDAMDNEESGDAAYFAFIQDFDRTQAAPEIDAFTFAKIAGYDNITKILQDYLKPGADVTPFGYTTVGDALLASLRDATTSLDENLVPANDRILFITPTLKNQLLTLETYKSTAALSAFSSVVTVPQSMFYTKIKLNDGRTSGETAGGYAIAEDGKQINFMIVQKSAVFKYVKHLVKNAIDPIANQTGDAWKYFYRCYAVVAVLENKAKGVYMSYRDAD